MQYTRKHQTNETNLSQIYIAKNY